MAVGQHDLAQHKHAAGAGDAGQFGKQPRHVSCGTLLSDESPSTMSASPSPIPCMCSQSSITRVSAFRSLSWFACPLPLRTWQGWSRCGQCDNLPSARCLPVPGWRRGSRPGGSGRVRQRRRQSFRGIMARISSLGAKCGRLPVVTMFLASCAHTSGCFMAIRRRWPGAGRKTRGPSAHVPAGPCLRTSSRRRGHPPRPERRKDSGAGCLPRQTQGTVVAAPASLLKKLATSPCPTPLQSRIASAKSLAAWITATGPKVSCWTRAASGSRPSTSVGRIPAALLEFTRHGAAAQEASAVNHQGALATAAMTSLRRAAETSGPTRVAGSSGSPTRNLAISRSSISVKRSRTDSSTMTRRVAVQRCPAKPKADPPARVPPRRDRRRP
jgi:hypothetical protein